MVNSGRDGQRRLALDGSVSLTSTALPSPHLVSHPYLASPHPCRLAAMARRKAEADAAAAAAASAHASFTSNLAAMEAAEAAEAAAKRERAKAYADYLRGQMADKKRAMDGAAAGDKATFAAANA